jgi:hypothetical protein
MKTITKFLLFVTFVAITTANAQDVLVVPPGIGTLNTAINTYGGDRIYQLEAGKFYQLNALIENNGYHLQIIGEEPTGGGSPAQLQTNANSGTVYEMMFNAIGNFTLKNVYIINADFSGNIANQFLNVNSAGANVVIDNCVLYPVGLSIAVNVYQPNVSLHFTNNIAINFGHQLSPNDGHFFASSNAPEGEGMDALYVENNTFVACGTGMYMAGFTGRHDGLIKWNHNTFIMQKSQIDWQLWEDTWIFTNNIMFDTQTQPWSQAWQPMPGGDPAAPKPGLIYATQLPDETLPSTRQQYGQYNLHYRNPDFYTLLDDLNVIQAANAAAPLTYMPFLWDSTYDETNPDINLRSRETILFADDTNFPNWKYGNEFNDIDPQFVDAKIYEHSDNFALWTNPATQIHAMAKDPASFPPVTEWAQWHWYPDNGDKPWAMEVWPVFNGVYTNSTMLTASLESLPMGDLNWFPTEKAIWEFNKSAIDVHVAAGNTDRIAMVDNVCDLRPSTSFTSQYEQDFTGGTWDDTAFYNQWDAQEANAFGAVDIADGYLKYVWPGKRVLQSIAEYDTPYRVEAEMMLFGGSNRGGLVLRAGPAGGIDEIQEPATGDPGFNRKGIAIYPSSDGTEMVVQFTNAFPVTEVTRINVPLQGDLTNLLTPAVKYNLKVEDLGSSIYVFINDNCLFTIDLSDLNDGIYSSGSVSAPDGTTLGSFTARYIPAKGKIAIGQRDANLQLYKAKIETASTLSVGDNEVHLSEIKVYPNPVKDRINLSATNKIKSMSVYNLLGEEVLRTSVNSRNYSADISNLKTGIYLVKLAIDDAVQTFKIVKQ